MNIIKTTERLFIRKVREEDALDVWNIWSNDGNQRYMYDTVTSIEEVKHICTDASGATDNHLTVLTLKDTGEIVGTCTFGKTSKEGQWGLGYSIKEEHWGKGYASEAVEAVVALAKENKITNIVADCVKENIASNKVLINNGFELYKTSSFVQMNTNIEFESKEYKIEI